MSVWTIVVAAGLGTRFGGAKHLADLGGHRVVDLSIAAAQTWADGVIVVVAREELEGFVAAEGVRVVEGGSTRSHSVREGLAAVPPGVEIIVVHDGARPLASAALFKRMIDTVAQGADAAVPVAELVDTIRHVDDGAVDRSKLVAVQTPQAFSAHVLRSAHEGRGDATDDAGLVEADGGTVELVEGERTNIKITLPEDLLVARTLMDHRDERGNT